MITHMNRIHRNQAGITGLETAIILIAFIVVASVFAYTVLSAGLFSAQKTEEVTRSGIDEAESTIQVMGNVVAYKGTANGDECVTKLLFTVGKALPGGGAIDLTPLYRVDPNGALVSPIISDCDTAWTSSGSGISVSTNAADYKEEPRSTKLVIASTSGSTTLAYYNLPDTMDLTYASQIGVWIKSSEERTAGDLQVLLCSGTSGASAVETIDMPVLPGNAWTEAVVALNDPGSGSLSAINSVALRTTAALSGVTIHLDELRTRTGVSTKNNVAMIAYNDDSTFIDDVAWTVEFAGGYGGGTGDYLLENSERATVTIWLQDYDGTNWSNGSGSDDPFIDSNGEHLKSSSAFSIQIMPPSGATMLIKKRTPAYLHDIMRLL